MVRVKVLDKNDLIRYLVKIILLVIAIIWLTRYFYDLQKPINIIYATGETAIQSALDSTYVTSIEIAMPIIKYDKTSEEQEVVSRNGTLVERLLDVELAIINNIKPDYIEQKTGHNIDNEVVDDGIIVPEKPPNVAETEIISTNNIASRYTNTYGTVQVRNESSYGLTEEMLKPDMEILNKQNILIFQTHTCESYTATEQNNYNMTGTYRTTDINFNMARVGAELANILKADGYSPIHDMTIHDYPSYSGSYDRSQITVDNILREVQDVDIVLDLHRDALGDNTYAPTVKIGEEYVSQLVIVVGTDGRRFRTSKLGTKFEICSSISGKSK